MRDVKTPTQLEKAWNELRDDILIRLLFIGKRRRDKSEA